MFCSKCGKEMRPDEKFCSQCGWSATQAGAPKEKIGKNIIKGITNVGINPNKYVALLATLVLTWMFFNSPLFACKSGFFGSYSFSMGFTQLAGDFGNQSLGDVSGVFAILSMILGNIALLGGIAMVALPAFLNAKIGPTSALLSIIASGVTLFFFLLDWIIFGTASGYTIVLPSVAGLFCVLAAAGNLVLSIFVYMEVQKKTPRPAYMGQ